MEIGRRTILQLSVLAGLGLLVKPHGIMEVLAMEGPETFEVVKTEEEWKALLTSAQYYVLREEGTERPFTNAYDANKATGTYHCAGCDLEVFPREPNMTAKPAGRVSGSRSRVEQSGPKPTGNCFIPEPRSIAGAVAVTSAIFSTMAPTDRPAVLYQLRSPSVSGSLR